MRKLLFLFLLIGACFTAVQAQDEVRPVEVFGGYSYLRTGNPYDEDSHGWNMAVSGNLTKYVAVKADFAGHYDNYTRANIGGAINVSNRLHTFLFGPQFNFRATERVNPFVHALFGVANDRTRATRGTAVVDYSDTGFAMVLGGGVDAKLNDSVSWRVFQTDYLLTRYRDPYLAPLARRQVNRFRFSTGLVFH